MALERRRASIADPIGERATLRPKPLHERPSGLNRQAAEVFCERGHRFRERDRFGAVGRCAVSIVDFLVSSGRVRAQGRWVLGMLF